MDADQGAKPPGPRTAGSLLISPNRLLPGPPCGPGVYALPLRQKELDRANTCKEKVQLYRSCCRTFHPACKVRPGADGSGMACRLSMAGVLGVRPPSRRPPVRKGGAFLGSSFGDERRITSRQAAGHLPPKACAFFPHRLFGDVKQRNSPAVARAGKLPAGSRNNRNHQLNQTFLFLLSAKEEYLNRHFCFVQY